MSAPVFPEHHSCIRCGGHLNFAERRQANKPCAACERESRVQRTEARTLKAIIEVVVS